jgi:poly-gamma-glutamate capsule biosynthesis protein CapA/YwtB (metallophosphatase superfamily)
VQWPRLPALILLLALASGCVALEVDADEPSPVPSLVPTVETLPSPTPQPPGRVTLHAVGDLMLERDIITLMDRHGSAHPFERVLPLLAGADVTAANMEGTFTERGSAERKLYVFRTPPRHAVGLREAGIDVVSLGNNHAMDYGREGLVDTLAALDAAGVKHSGAGLTEAEARQPAFVEARGLRLAFLSYNAVLEATFASGSGAGVARASAAAIREDVSAARAEADIVIVSLHAGREYTDEPTSEQRTLGRAAIDAGALVVLGHHPHVLQGWERYGNGIIVYSLGNFVFDLDYDDYETLGPRPFQSIVLRLELERDAVLSASYEPVFIDIDENRPRPATPAEAEAIERRLRSLSASGP